MNKIFIPLMVTILLLGACAESEQQEDVYDHTEEIKTNNGGLNEISSDDDFKGPPTEITTDEDGNTVYECNVEENLAKFGNQYHVVYMAESDDAINWENEQYIMSGSVPEVIYFNDKYLLFVMGNCLMWESEDGMNFQPYTYTLIEGGEQTMNLGGVDPSAIIDDGLIRLFFYEPQHDGQPGDPALIEGDHPFTEYTSEDGITWTSLGEVYATEKGTDPDAVMYNDEYFLFISKGTGVLGAVSDDAITYTELNGGELLHNEGGVPDTIVIDDTLYMYGHKHVGEATSIRVMTSTDGTNWEYQEDVIDGEAPSILQLPDGSYRIYFVKSVGETEYEELSS
jgi:hypothetical protein